MPILSELFNDLKFILRFRKKHVQQQKNLDRLAPKAGDLAPDFTLSDLSGTTSITLSEYRGKKPVVLVFGSYT